MLQRSTVQVLVAQLLLRKDSPRNLFSGIFALARMPQQDGVVRQQVDANCRGREQLTRNGKMT